MKRSQVRALLRKANATMNHLDYRGPHVGCEVGNSTITLTLSTENSWEFSFREDHVVSASLLLFGLDLRDVTEAGG